MRQTILYGVISILMAVGLLTAVPALAQSQSGAPGPNGWGAPRSGMMHGSGVFGTVSAISGDTITLSSKGFGRNATSTTAYTVDATNATVMKDGTSSSVGSIAVGDTLMVQGSVNGTSVTATNINDGIMPKGMPGRGNMASSTLARMPQFQGNGEPVVGGSVSTISGDTLTITNKSNVTYTVDATNATIIVKNATSTIASIVTGDNVVVQGSVNGNSVTASSIIDQGTQPSPGNGTGPGMMHGFGGVFGAIGGFFQHLFGFF